MKTRFAIVVALLLAASSQCVGQEAATRSASATSTLSLADATKAALAQVTQFRQARLDEAAAAEDLTQARAAALPRLRSATSVIYNSPALLNRDAPSFIAQNAVHEYQELVGFAGDLDFGVVASVRRSRALLDAARAGTEIARRALVRGVTEAYFGAALATAKRTAADESLAAAAEFERITALNFQAGEVPEVDVLRARLLTAARRDDLAQARQNEVVANASLVTLLGVALEQTVSIEPLPQTIDASELATLTSSGVERRPELAQFDAQLRAARADVGIARAGILPRIIYSLDEGFDSNSLSSDELRQHRGVLAQANVDLPLFDWGATRSKLRQAELKAESATLGRTLAVRDLQLQFVVAKQEATTAAERVDNATAAVHDATRNVEISIARYRAGEGPISEATDAQTTLATQRLALEQALFDYQIARAHLREAAGE